jgi:hypothetical protein
MAPILRELLLEPPRRLAEASGSLLKREIVRGCRHRHSLTCSTGRDHPTEQDKGSKFTKRRGARIWDAGIVSNFMI